VLVIFQTDFSFQTKHVVFINEAVVFPAETALT